MSRKLDKKLEIREMYVLEFKKVLKKRLSRSPVIFQAVSDLKNAMKDNEK